MQLRRLLDRSSTPDRPRWLWQLRWWDPTARRQRSRRIGYYALARDNWRPAARGRCKPVRLMEREAETLRTRHQQAVRESREGLAIPVGLETRTRWQELCATLSKPSGLAFEYFVEHVGSAAFQQFLTTAGAANLDPRQVLQELLADWVERRLADAPASWQDLTAWFEERGSPNAGPRTRRESATTFKLFKELCPELLARWRTLTVDDARLFQVRVAKDREPATVVKHLANLRKLWNACKKSWVKENPWAQLAFPKVGADPESWHYFPAEEVARLLAAADDVWKARIRLAWKSGLRPGEIDHLRVADVDWSGARVRVRRHRPNKVTLDWDPKDKDARTIPIDADTLQALRKLKARCGRNPYLLVREPRWRQALGKQKRKQWRQDLALVNGKKKVWDRLLKAAKIPDHDGSPEFYSLRKTCCCDMLDGGAASHEVQAMMGHADLKTTMTWYAKVNKAAAERRIREAQSRTG